MEAAPLTSAHALARDAFQHTPKSSLAAADKHKAAAGEFTKAAQGVEDSEALRVLNLLEQHHHRLAQIISSASEHALIDPSNDSSTKHIQSPKTTTTPSTATTAPLPVISEETSQRVPSAVVHRRPTRDLTTSSIASNLATARGIPHGQQRRQTRPLSPPTPGHDVANGITPLQNGKSRDPSQAITDLRDSQSVRLQTVRTTAPPLPPTPTGLDRDTAREESKIESKEANDDPFQRFYSTFEGLLSRLSAPLAFAGLPLTSDDQSDQRPDNVPQTRKATTNPATASTSPDISKIFSKAALRAVRDEESNKSVQESFFVVPTGGGTVSYAGILSRAERQARGHSLETPLEQPEEEAGEQFVDAREMPQLRSSGVVKQGQRVSTTTTGKTVEELATENQSLKELTDKLSRRLYMWEKSAQSQSMALQQSIRTLQPPSRALSEVDSEEKGVEHYERLRELEEQIRDAQKEMERYGRENEKLRTVVMRYRERWDRLKEGAKARAREGSEKGTETPR